MLDKTVVYQYNNNGNIVGVETYPYIAPDATPTGTPTTKTFAYDTAHPDRLVTFDSKAITYNANGEMTSFDGKSYAWNKGKLSSVTETVTSDGLLRAKPGLPTILGSKAYSFSYNAFGQRTGVNYAYTVNSSSSGSIAASEVVAYAKRFFYDHAGRLMFETKTSTSYSLGDEYYEIAYLYDKALWSVWS